MKVDNLYLDCNSIIYDAYNKMEFDSLTESVAVSIIRRVILKIEEYISIVEPSNKVIVAFDGVAPVAKLEQQRGRRYKAWYQNEISKQIYNKSGSKQDAFSTTAITPGTKFMAELNQMIGSHFANRNDVIVSGSDIIGEGEHKIFDYMRTNPTSHHMQTTVIYGLDADLIMLSLNHLGLSPNIYLFRETPHFIQSIDSSLEPDANYFIDIPEFARSLCLYMTNNNICKCNYDDSQIDIGRIQDYILLCFFLGNDFMPHFPALNIRTGGVDKMLNSYKATIGSTNKYLYDNDNTRINWSNLREVVGWLAKQEEDYIITEHNKRNAMERRLMPETTADEKFKSFESVPCYNREVEKYIFPTRNGWQRRYYKALLNMDSREEAKVENLCRSFLEALEWTMKYYSRGCYNWRWKYHYNYPPLLNDLVRFIPVDNRELVQMRPCNPVSPFVQLCYVLPRSSLHLLPTKLEYALKTRYDKWYKGDCEFQWAYCRYFWESHVEMNDIDIDELESFLSHNPDLLRA